ncbi:DNA adenine methylase [Xylanibacter ruminicola]|uniref:site-specific DNA-methyltransferase (adenine-specific) n=1 Tax=Xylanibacter ruminicola TaxID=839 RepID=A0A1M7D4U6_XYLRU|nr:Dam family site-specific DNA-(adenine-N6)-methyltransferase [Xylanibacter ruminicola]SHL74516.1 DNA adenine methylase [Xylanibacter ruminicola]
MKPIIKYRGGKSKEIPQFIQYIPNYAGRYIEPFFGGGAVYFHLEPHNAIINDINARLMNFYTAVQQNYPQLRDELRRLEEIYTANRAAFDELKAQHPTERVEDANEPLYYNLRNMYNGLIDAEYSDAALYYFINKTAYSGMIRFNARGEYNVPYGRYKNFNTGIITEQHSNLLQRAQIHNGDYHAIFDMAQPDDFMFLDPPYDCVFSDYGNEEYRDGFNEANHRMLAQDFYNLGCHAMMVIGATPLTRELYGGNIVAEYGKQYSVNIRNRFQAAAQHIVVTNYGI